MQRPGNRLGIWRRTLCTAAALALTACADRGAERQMQPRQFTQGPFTIVEQVQPLAAASPAGVDAAVARYERVLTGLDLQPEEAGVLAGRLREILTATGPEAGFTPAMEGIRDIRTRLDSLEAAGRISAANAALAVEVPWAIICQELGCPVKRTIGGKACTLIGNVWFGSWFCVYLCW